MVSSMSRTASSSASPCGGGVTSAGATYGVSFGTGSTGGIRGYDTFGPITEKCPQLQPVTTTARITDWIDDGFGGPYKVKPGGVLHDSGRSVIDSSSFHAEKGWSWYLRGMSCPRPNTQTGDGYEQLTPAMKNSLARLYKILNRQRACYRFNIGFRTKAKQTELYDRWHQIADGHEKQKNLCDVLKAANFAQCPTDWTKNGIAKGGPAKPGTSRHERAEAADLTVRFPAGYLQNLGSFHEAAHEAGLCGPSRSDPVHVELPYRIRGQREPACHFEGPDSRRPCLVLCIARVPQSGGATWPARSVLARLR